MSIDSFFYCSQCYCMSGCMLLETVKMNVPTDITWVFPCIHSKIRIFSYCSYDQRSIKVARLQGCNERRKSFCLKQFRDFFNKCSTNFGENVSDP